MSSLSIQIQICPTLYSFYLVREPAGEDGVPGELAHVAGGELPDLVRKTRFDIT